jgi:hypothetical protein
MKLVDFIKNRQQKGVSHLHCNYLASVDCINLLKKDILIMKTLTTLNKQFIAAAAVAFVTLASPAANAATTSLASLNDIITDASYLDGDFSFQGTNGVVSVTYSGATPVSLAVGANTIANQNYDTVGNTVKTIFGAGAFVGSGYQVNSASSIMSGSVATFSSPAAYNYLAIHFGKHEMIFDFGSTGVAANTAFKIATSGAAAGLSNFRAYTAIPTPPPVATPIPAAAWLFGSGLVSLLGFRKKSGQALPA